MDPPDNQRFHDEDPEPNLRLLTPSSESSDRHDRREMEWNERTTELMRTFFERATKASHGHYKKMKFWKCIYIVLGLPSCLLPASLAVITPYIEENKLLMTILLLISALLSVTSTFIDAGSKREAHDQASAKYEALSTDIEAILATSKKDRIACDITITEYRLKFNHLGSISPSL